MGWLHRRLSRTILLLLIIVSTGLLSSCHGGGRTAGTAASPSAYVHFTDVTSASGIHFRHWNGGCGKKYYLEEMGGGCAFLDYDNDGWEDILLLNGAPIDGCAASPAPSAPYPALYHNNHDGTFTDVTEQVGLKTSFYAIGVAVGDYDNDGWEDIFISGYGGSHLFHNVHGHFVDVTAKAGVGQQQFPSSCCWVDYDNDGYLDLYVCGYVNWDVAHDIKCGTPSKPVYCSPEVYQGSRSYLYHNNRDGTFTEVAESLGCAGEGGKSLGVTTLDYDRDGWMDIFVANDGKPNFLFHNDHGKGFHNVALEAGVALPESGTPKSGMGTDAADYNHTGLPSIVIGNFHREGLTLDRNQRNGFFEDVSSTAGLTGVSLDFLTFGCFFFDYDLDGYKDILAADGHVIDTVNESYPRVTYAERPLLLFNRGNGTFQECGIGAGLTEQLVARGACYGDYDNDGDLDLLIATDNGPAHLYRNDGGNRNHWLKVKAVGTVSNRDAIGTRVELEAANGKQVDWIRSGSSYCAENDRRLVFGLGAATTADRVTLTFPSGRVVRLQDVPANQVITVQEPAKG